MSGHRWDCQNPRPMRDAASGVSLPSDSWVAEGCAMVRRLMEQGHSGQAAKLARYVERRALGRALPKLRPEDRFAPCPQCGTVFQRTADRLRYCSRACRYEHFRLTAEQRRENKRRYIRAARAKGCSVVGCSNLRLDVGRPWCWRHAPHVWRVLRGPKDREAAVVEVLQRLESIEREAV